MCPPEITSPDVAPRRDLSGQPWAPWDWCGQGIAQSIPARAPSVHAYPVQGPGGICMGSCGLERAARTGGFVLAGAASLGWPGRAPVKIMTGPLGQIPYVAQTG